MAIIGISDKLRANLKADIENLKPEFGQSRLTYTFIIEYWRNKATGLEHVGKGKSRK